jgi:foldase protein PrsA
MFSTTIRPIQRVPNALPRSGWLSVWLILALTSTGCSHAQDGVTGKFRKRQSDKSQTSPMDQAPDLVDENAAPGDAIAYIDGTPISRSRMVNLLLAGHGVGILEQIIVLEKAKVLAAQQNIRVTSADIDAEFERSLHNLIAPLQTPSDMDFDRETSEKLLDEVLARRNVSRAECLAMVERNAYLRAICNANFQFTDEQYAEEYALAFGPRVQVRHIQLANLTEADHVLKLLRDGGDFATLAIGYSANMTTGPQGGLLRPFSRDDPSVPRALRETAFRLREKEVSDPVRDGQWYQIVRVVRHIPADERPMEQVKGELDQRLRERLTEPAMQTLYRSLFEQADIRITDPVLAEEFAKKHSNRN